MIAMLITKEFNLLSSLKTIILLISPFPIRICIGPMGSIYNNLLLLIKTGSEMVLILCSFCIKNQHAPHNYSLVMQEVSLISLADRCVNANVEFLKNLVDGCINAPSLLSLVNFKVPSRTFRYHVLFIVLAYTINYGRNNPLGRMMRFANESTIY